MSCLKSQALGGKSIFEFTNGPVTARVTALGGSILGVLDDDVALAYTNPAQINEAMHQSLTFAQNIHFADIGQSFISYGRHIKKLNLTFHGGFFLSNQMVQSLLLERRHYL